jgi:hypothetical protein
MWLLASSANGGAEGGLVRSPSWWLDLEGGAFDTAQGELSRRTLQSLARAVLTPASSNSLRRWGVFGLADDSEGFMQRNDDPSQAEGPGAATGGEESKAEAKQRGSSGPIAVGRGLNHGGFAASGPARGWVRSALLSSIRPKNKEMHLTALMLSVAGALASPGSIRGEAAARAVLLSALGYRSSTEPIKSFSALVQLAASDEDTSSEITQALRRLVDSAGGVSGDTITAAPNTVFPSLYAKGLWDLSTAEPTHLANVLPGLDTPRSRVLWRLLAALGHSQVSSPVSTHVPLLLGAADWAGASFLPRMLAGALLKKQSATVHAKVWSASLPGSVPLGVEDDEEHPLMSEEARAISRMLLSPTEYPGGSLEYALLVSKIRGEDAGIVELLDSVIKGIRQPVSMGKKVQRLTSLKAWKASLSASAVPSRLDGLLVAGPKMQQQIGSPAEMVRSVLAAVLVSATHSVIEPWLLPPLPLPGGPPPLAANTLQAWSSTVLPLPAGTRILSTSGDGDDGDDEEEEDPEETASREASALLAALGVRDTQGRGGVAGGPVAGAAALGAPKRLAPLGVGEGTVTLYLRFERTLVDEASTNSKRRRRQGQLGIPVKLSPEEDVVAHDASQNSTQALLLPDWKDTVLGFASRFAQCDGPFDFGDPSKVVPPRSYVSGAVVALRDLIKGIVSNAPPNDEEDDDDSSSSRRRQKSIPDPTAESLVREEAAQAREAGLALSRSLGIGGCLCVPIAMGSYSDIGIRPWDAVTATWTMELWVRVGFVDAAVPPPAADDDDDAPAKRPSAPSGSGLGKRVALVRRYEANGRGGWSAQWELGAHPDGRLFFEGFQPSASSEGSADPVLKELESRTTASAPAIGRRSRRGPTGEDKGPSSSSSATGKSFRVEVSEGGDEFAGKLQPNQWQHVAVVVDGKRAATAARKAQINSTEAVLDISLFLGGEEVASGSITALPALWAELRSKNGKAGSVPGLDASAGCMVFAPPNNVGNSAVSEKTREPWMSLSMSEIRLWSMLRQASDIADSMDFHLDLAEARKRKIHVAFRSEGAQPAVAETGALLPPPVTSRGTSSPKDQAVDSPKKGLGLAPPSSSGAASKPKRGSLAMPPPPATRKTGAIASPIAEEEDVSPPEASEPVRALPKLGGLGLGRPPPPAATKKPVKKESTSTAE